MTNRPRKPVIIAVAALLATALLLLLLLWNGTGQRATPEPNSQPTASVPAASVRGPGLSGPAAAAFPDNPEPPAPVATLPPRHLTQRTLPYGSGPGEIGMIRDPGQTPIGPESFTITADGNILIADLANRRLLLCGPNGALLRSIPTGQVNLNDLVTDRQGRLFVYDQRERMLFREQPGGATGEESFVPALRLNPADIDTRGYFHVVDDNIYFADAAARDVLVAVIDGEGALQTPEAVERVSPGIHAASGRVYDVASTKGEGLRVVIYEAPQAQGSAAINLPMPDLLAARFIGEDNRGRFYAQVERLVGGRVLLEVHEFGPAGERLRVTPLPENDYALWTAKLAQAGPGGRIIQFLPGETEAKLNLLSE